MLHKWFTPVFLRAHTETTDIIKIQKCGLQLREIENLSFSPKVLGNVPEGYNLNIQTCHMGRKSSHSIHSFPIHIVEHTQKLDPASQQVSLTCYTLSAFVNCRPLEPLLINSKKHMTRRLSTAALFSSAPCDLTSKQAHYILYPSAFPFVAFQQNQLCFTFGTGSYFTMV